MKSHIVIKVTNLPLCEEFYRNILQIGAPEMSASFGVFFKLGEDSGLYLVKTTAKFLEHGSSAANWCFSTPDMAALEARLKKAGYPLLKETFHLGYDECRRGIDPEGNQYFVMEEK